ncbi:NADH dehydrogenase [ubiquinone] 1 alpha subcomplex subunit 13-B [Scenedesmus sp. PABB004]|nr:NADH dehydrogenase [ubiquinone] 1 alpha subcomplex subunit 13-B [Scenedesmus sp. PABB004]
MGAADSPPPRGGAVRRALAAAWAYAAAHTLELPANALEALTLVLIVFVQDVAFAPSVAVCACLVTASLALHGLAYRRGQCRVYPKVIELAAPVLFYGLTPAAFAAPGPTARAAFIVINFFFLAVEAAAWALLGRCFMDEYLRDWSPREAWGTPLLAHCAAVTAASWMACQALMGTAQVIVVVTGVSLDTHPVAAVWLCYVLQLVPLLFAVQRPRHSQLAAGGGTMTETLKRGFPGMVSVKDMPIVQDMPPVGGFPSIRIQRRLPSTGPTGVAIFAVGGAVMAYGYYNVYHLIQDRKAGLRELEMHRAPIIPVLQAEEDIRWVAANKAALAEEARIMKNVPGWEVGKSNSATGRWIPPPAPFGIEDPMLK